MAASSSAAGARPGDAGSGPPVVVVNVGSSSVKLSRVEGGVAVASGSVTRNGTDPDALDVDALGARVDALLAGPEPAIVAHRFVHGGPQLTAAARLTPEVRAELARWSPLAPLHQPGALAAAEALARRRPELVQVGCFDTAFHTTLPAAARTWALPPAWRDLGVRRYGFHGLSYRSLLDRIADRLGRADRPDRVGGALAGTGVVACHLGSGSSACALDGGRSVDTTMGLTPVGGMLMATRPGDLDPGILAWLRLEHGLSPEDLDRGLWRESGLLGLAGTSRMEEVVARAEGDAGTDPGLADAPAERPRVVFGSSQGAALALACALPPAPRPRLDAVVFTGGIGARSPEVRAGIAARLTAFGVALDDDANRNLAGDGDISGVNVFRPGPGVRVLVLEAQEDVVAADEARQCVAGAAAAPAGTGGRT